MKKKKILVIGGSGFLGKALVRQCLGRGDHVVSFSRGSHPELTRLGVPQIRGDVAHAQSVFEACRGMDAVFHLAARMGFWGRFAEYYKTNVKGTRHVIAACKRNGVPVMVYTGTTRSRLDRSGRYVDENDGGYPERFTTNYAMSKAFAEQAVLRAADANFRCMVLRPHMIWGPGVRVAIPGLPQFPHRLVRIGNGRNRVSGIYIDNAARAHLMAADALADDAALSGTALFLGQDDPIPLWDLIDRSRKRPGGGRPGPALPPWAARFLAGALEWGYKGFNLRGYPPVTKSLVDELAGSHVFDTGALRDVLGFVPPISVEAGLECYERWLENACRLA
ncbi:NAD-dependent epimerase/dehydratase family protein [Desulfatiferula olefinivorans]